MTEFSVKYDEVLRSFAEALDERCDQALNLVVIDGLPASGKSTLTRRVEEHLADLGRSTGSLENDWFISKEIRNPVALMKGMAVALSRLGRGRVEESLLRVFLDKERLGRFKEAVRGAKVCLEAGESVHLRPEGAFWNLRYPPSWEGSETARGFVLEPGAVLLIEGTLSRAVWQEAFPELVSMLVLVPVEAARARFLARNRRRATRRNRAFSALAYQGSAFRLASEMLVRNRARYDFTLNLGDLEAPVLRKSDEIR